MRYRRLPTLRGLWRWPALGFLLALTLVLAGGSSFAVGLLTRPAEVRGQPVSATSGGGFDAKMGWPGHPIQVSVAQGGSLAGFHLLTLQGLSSAKLDSITYVPRVVPVDRPTPVNGGSVNLAYSINGTEILINQALDADPSGPLQINQKIAPGYAGPLCTSVQTIDGGQYVFARCPDGEAINGVFWKTLAGIDVSVMRAGPSATSKSTPPSALSMSLVLTVIEHLR